MMDEWTRPFPLEPPAESERVLAELREQIRSRLEPVIGHLPPTEVERLIDRIANFKYRHEGTSALRTTPTRADQLDQ